MPETLLQLDIAGIQHYVLGSGPGNLKAIRGASHLLKVCSEQTWVDLLAEITGARLIMAGGGNLLAVLPGEAEARNFAAAAQRALTGATAVATVRSAWVPYEGNRLADAKSRLDQALARVKAEADPGSGTLPAYSFCAQCDLCGSVPAVAADTEENLLCTGCERRLSAARAAKNAMPFPSQRPEDLEELALHSQPRNYLAFIYIDFDGMGTYFTQAAKGGELVFGALSAHFDNAVTAALASGVAGISKMEPLLIGGDDLAIVMPADRWLSFLSQFAEGFQRRYATAPDGVALPPMPTFSAGVVIAHSHFPISEFFAIAKPLLQSAKSVEGAASVDFETISSSVSGNPVELRMAAGKRNNDWLQTAKPYPLAQLMAIAKQASELKQILPGSKKNFLYHLAFGGENQSQIDYLYLLSRLEPAAREQLRHPGLVGPNLWLPQSADGRRRTRACDLVELMEYL